MNSVKSVRFTDNHILDMSSEGNRLAHNGFEQKQNPIVFNDFTPKDFAKDESNERKNKMNSSEDNFTNSDPLKDESMDDPINLFDEFCAELEMDILNGTFAPMNETEMRLLYHCETGNLHEIKKMIDELNRGGTGSKDSGKEHAAKPEETQTPVTETTSKDFDIHFQNDLLLRFAVRGGNSDVVTYLLQQGLDINADHGDPLRCSAFTNNTYMFRYLLEMGASLSAELITNENFSHHPFIYAVINGNKDIAMAYEISQLTIPVLIIAMKNAIDLDNYYFAKLIGTALVGKIDMDTKNKFLKLAIRHDNYAIIKLINQM
jgi:hypothetical protein